MRSLLTSLIAVALAFPSAAQSAVVNRKLSGPMATGIVGDVREFAISPSGSHVLYVVSRGSEPEGIVGESRVEVAPTDGSGDPIVLSAYHEFVRSVRWTPDETRAVFVATRNDDRHELYSVPTDGSAPPTLLFPLGSSQSVAGEFGSFERTVQITGDGSRVVYLLERPGVEYELFSVPIAGGVPKRLSGVGFEVSSFLVSASTVIYQQGSIASADLLAVPADGSTTSVNLTALPIHGPVWDGFTIDASGTHVVYRAVPPGQTGALFTVPLDGSAAPLRLSSELPSPRHVASFRVSPSGAGVAYRSSQGADNNPAELFFVPIDGSAQAKLLATGQAGSDGVEEGYEFSPDEAHVVYAADTDGTGPPDLLSSVRVSDGSIATLYSGSTGFRIAPDSSRVVFGFGALYSVPIDGTSPPVQITPASVDGGGVRSQWEVTADSSRVVYLADAETDEHIELYEVAIVPSGTPVATKLNHPLPGSGEVGAFQIAPDSSFVLYRVDSTPVELYTSQGQVAISDPLPVGEVGDVSTFVARHGRVVYRADQEVGGKIELFGAPADGSAAPVKLSGVLPGDREVRDFELSPDGSTVVYRAGLISPIDFELFAVPSDGSSAPILLNGALAPGGFVSSYAISPDGVRVVYSADQADAPGWHLYSTPIQGGTSVALASTGVSVAFEFTSDSTHVLSEAANHLYSSPIDGSTSPVNLSGPPTDIVGFEATPDGSRVVFLAISGGVRHLFSNAIDGGSLLDLSAGLGTAGSILSFQLSVDGERVVFRGDNGVAGQFRLMSVPVDGSASGLVLNGPLVAGGDVHAFEVSPDGVHVVYLADQAIDGSEWFHRVRLDGSAPDVPISTQDFGLSLFAIAPDGANIVIEFNGLQSLRIAGGILVPLSSSTSEFAFVAGGRRVVHQEGNRLMRTPINGGSSVALSPVLPGTLWDFAVDGSRVVYRAEQDVDDLVELYASWVVELAEHAPPVESRSITR